MAWNLPDGVTDDDIDRAAGGYDDRDDFAAPCVDCGHHFDLYACQGCNASVHSPRTWQPEDCHCVQCEACNGVVCPSCRVDVESDGDKFPHCPRCAAVAIAEQSESFEEAMSV